MAKIKLTEELIEEMCRLKLLGLNHKTLYSGLGISEGAFYRWLARGEKAVGTGSENLYSKFHKAFKKAEMQHKTRLLEQIQKTADKGTWQASVWELEHCYPMEYGKKAQDVVEVAEIGKESKEKVKKPDFSLLTLEELEKLDEITEKLTNKGVYTSDFEIRDSTGKSKKVTV